MSIAHHQQFEYLRVSNDFLPYVNRALEQPTKQAQNIITPPVVSRRRSMLSLDPLINNKWQSKGVSSPIPFIPSNSDPMTVTQEPNTRHRVRDYSPPSPRIRLYFGQPYGLSPLKRNSPFISLDSDSDSEDVTPQSYLRKKRRELQKDIDTRMNSSFELMLYARTESEKRRYKLERNKLRRRLKHLEMQRSVGRSGLVDQ